MFTADKARNMNAQSLDARIKKEVDYAVSSGLTRGYLRIYIEDAFFNNIEEELTIRGFHSIQVPDITLKGDVYFSWD